MKIINISVSFYSNLDTYFIPGFDEIKVRLGSQSSFSDGTGGITGKSELSARRSGEAQSNQDTTKTNS